MAATVSAAALGEMVAHAEVAHADDVLLKAEEGLKLSLGPAAARAWALRPTPADDRGTDDPSTRSSTLRCRLPAPQDRSHTATCPTTRRGLRPRTHSSTLCARLRK